MLDRYIKLVSIPKYIGSSSLTPLSNYKNKVYTISPFFEHTNSILMDMGQASTHK